MKNIKTFETKARADEATKALESNDIWSECHRDDLDNYALFVHISDFILARDILIENGL